MKRSTIILLAIAALFAGAVYFFDVKRGAQGEEKTGENKPAVNFKADDIAELELVRSGQDTRFEKKDGKWFIEQPISTLADQVTVSAIADGIADAQVERSISASQDDIKSFGLEQPAVVLSIKLKNGQLHKISLGSKEFSGSYVYARIDDAKDIALLPLNVLDSSDKSLNDMRDRDVLDVPPSEVDSFSLKNESDSLALKKEESNWLFTSPTHSSADNTEITSLLSEVNSSKATDVVSETASDAARYGLQNPVISFTAHLDDGSERGLMLSKKDEKYYAKASDHPQIFRVEEALYKILDKKFSDLRDKKLVDVNRGELSRIKLTNPNLTMEAEKSRDGKWIIQQPAESKGKEAQISKVLDPLETRSEAILDKPTQEERAKLAQPAVQMELTDASGKTTTIKISFELKGDVYASVNGSPDLYKFPKKLLDDLSFKPEEVVD